MYIDSKLICGDEVINIQENEKNISLLSYSNMSGYHLLMNMMWAR